MEKIKFSPNRLFDVDEAGITQLYNIKPSIDVALRGK
jgi:hypothetical protein